MRGTGSDFVLSGTTDQPDAGTMRGDPITLTGGFWFALLPTDCNEDKAANLLDHDSSIHCIDEPDGGVSTGCECFDVDRSGTIDLRDFATVQSVFAGP